MRQHAEDLEFDTDGEGSILDISEQVAQVVARSEVILGQVLVFTVSSTSAITTLEFEPGLVDEDVPQALDRLFPRHGEGVEYGHQRMWGDGNGHSHVRACFLQPDLTVPLRDGKPLLGTWQQIVFVDLDNKARRRSVAVHVWGN